ncbi:unannotated protein [freshwater metagenome]|uniref:Unannotated protein n=1 Tax=freshwater metagenome TaxID=449393 RepID=A0A6J6HK74_9ZZZZ|nr:hypothetical protein [Actinomycetota bacterium]MSY39215.1 hypothetical protein [Actinomycetota bacterium]MSZ40787.1 hypothetical protein [Actinomycetota bacterium]
MRALVKNENESLISGLPGFSVLDLFHPDITEQTREELFTLACEFHVRYFPESPHAIDEWRAHIQTGESPTRERVHVWLIFKDTKPVGMWAVNVNIESGVALMLFGAVDKEARSNLPHTWLRSFLDALIELCVTECEVLGRKVDLVALESEMGLKNRWESAGFALINVPYFEPTLGMHWANAPEVTFYENNHLFVRSLDPNTRSDSTDSAQRALQAFVVAHYQLDVTIPQVATMLSQEHERNA